MNLLNKLIGKKEDLVKLPPIAYAPAIGAFGIFKTDKIEWETCRDRMQNKAESIDHFLFRYSSKSTAENVIEFMRTVEQIIGVGPEQALELKKTTNNVILWVKMSSWWKYRLRRSLLTALLRCGQEYKDHNGEGFQKALWSQSYTAESKYAVERFLSGYTASKLKKRDIFQGWMQFFHNNKLADRFLVKKKSTTEITGQ